MEILKITDKVFRYYTKKVKGNRGITVDLASRKLTRNVLLANRIPPRNEEDVQKGNVLWHYGNLYILTRNNCVIHIKNHWVTNEYTEWELDELKYFELSKQLGIID